MYHPRLSFLNGWLPLIVVVFVLLVMFLLSRNDTQAERACSHKVLEQIRVSEQILTDDEWDKFYAVGFYQCMEENQ